MSLLINRLRALPTGTRIQLSYGFMDGQTLAFSGTITDKDDTAMEIRDGSGNSAFIDFSTVRFFSLLPDTAPGLNPVQSTAAPAQTAIPQKQLLCQKNIEQLTFTVSDQELKRNFDTLGREEKKLLQKSFDSFLYGIRCGSAEKRSQAAQSARRTIFQAEDQEDYCWSGDACALAARMLSRVGIWDARLYAMAGMREEAALCGFRDNDLLTAGVHAALALTEPRIPGRREDMVIILAHACAELADVSALDMLQQSGVSLSELREDLLLNRQKTATGDTGKDMDLLRSLYPATAIGAALSRETAAEAPEVRTGMISRILWVNSTGQITFPDGDEEITVPFHYRDVADPSLLERISGPVADPGKRNLTVRFLLEDNEAVQITGAPSPLNLAHEALGDEDYLRCCWFCRNAMGSSEAKNALTLMVDAALTSGDRKLLEETAAFCDANGQQYPRNCKSLSLLGQLHQNLHRLESGLKLTEEALGDETAPGKLRASILVQYMNYAMGLYNETGDESWIRGLDEKADMWLSIFQDELPNEPQCIKRHSRVLTWKIRGLLVKGMVDEAEEVFGLLARKFPQDPKLQTVSGLICRARQKLLETSAVPSAPQPDFTMQEEEPEETEDYEVPAPETLQQWDDLNMTGDDFVRRVLQMPGPDPLAAQLAALKAGAMLNTELEALYDTLSAAVNNPLEACRYDANTLTRLLSSADPRYPALNRYAAACVYLRTIFENDDAPVWLRQCISMEEIPEYGQVLDLLEDFRRDCGHAPDRYAAYRDHTHMAGLRQQEDLIGRARQLYEGYITAPARDSGTFGRFAHTKALAHKGLKTYLEWILREDRENLLYAQDAFSREFLAADGRVSPEKVDAYIITVWDSTAKDYPNGDSAVLQGSRRNALRGSLRAMLSLIRDCYRQMDRQETPARTEAGTGRFSSMVPLLRQRLLDLSLLCSRQDGISDPETRTGMGILGFTARELLGKLDGKRLPNQEQYLFWDFLDTNQVPLTEDFLPDFSGLLTGPLGLIGRIFAHAEAEKLDPQAHMDRIFSRDQIHFRNFDTAALIRRRCEITGQEITTPETERYVNQAKLMAALEFEELRQALRASRDTEGETLLLWLYDHCRRTLRFGFLAEGMEILRSRSRKGADEAA